MCEFKPIRTGSFPRLFCADCRCCPVEVSLILQSYHAYKLIAQPHPHQLEMLFC